MKAIYRQRVGPTTHSTGRAISWPFIENLNGFGGLCAPVNPGVRPHTYLHMDEETQSTVDKLGRQPDPEPPPYIASTPPSLLLYACLLVFALFLSLLAFRLKAADWPGFLLNLATEIIGAVIILILVERRFRANEIRFIQGIPETTSSWLSTWYLGEAREVKAYVLILASRVKLASLPFYLSRPQVEAILEKNRSKGMILIGAAGMGKTTLLHHLVRTQAKDVLKNPQSALVPIILPVGRLWSDVEAVEALRTAMRDFYPVKDRNFRRLLEGGRLLCIFDGVDELLNTNEVLEKIKRFRAQYPDNVLIISSRPLGYDAFEELELEQFVIPPLTEEEMNKLLRLRGRLDKANA
ncbi:MAG TPA: NACHT domain-containing protein [Pyrinomonadaceae bacterium]|nr:NACHT domain-containing protein [Pyrinomonadaceae bacterium]